MSLNEISLNIITGIINPQYVKTLGQIIPDRCVPTMAGSDAGWRYVFVTDPVISS